MTNVEIAGNIRQIANELLKARNRDEVRDLLLQLRLYCDNKAIKELKINYSYTFRNKTKEKEREK